MSLQIGTLLWHDPLLPHPQTLPVLLSLRPVDGLPSHLRHRSCTVIPPRRSPQQMVHGLDDDGKH